MKNGSLAGLVQGLLTLSGDNPASLVTKDELGQVKSFIKLAMKIKIAEAMRGGTTYTYDGNGNIISADNASYEYDSQNRLTNALINGQPVGTYSYDAMSRRVKKTAYGVTTYSIYDQFSSLIAESDASGNITREYIYLNGQPLALIDVPLPSSAPPQTISQQVSGSCGTIFAWNPKEGILGYVFILSPFLFVIFFKFTRSSKKSFILLIGFLGSAFIISLLAFQPSRLQAQTNGEVIYYFHNDHLGTPIKLTDSSQTVVWSWQYGPLGEEPLTMEPNAISQNLRFPGQYYDAETGLHYNFHRYYSPKLGRYLTPDKINSLDPSLHNYFDIFLANGLSTVSLQGKFMSILRYLPNNIGPYIYVNNPINGFDPYGLLGWDSVVRFLVTHLAKEVAFWLGYEIKDSNEVPEEADDDGDGIPNYLDSDSKYCRYNCTVKNPNDIPELSDDNGDGIPNYLDPDSKYCRFNCRKPCN